MRGLIQAGVLASACPLMAAQAAAEPQAPLIDCWDGSFAYTMVGLRVAEAGYEVRVTTQDEVLFGPVFPEAELDWGQADLDVVFAEDACTVDPARGLFSCHANEAALTLTKHERSGDPGYSVSATFRGVAIEFVEVVRAGDTEPPVPMKLLLIDGASDNRDVGLRVGFDYPEYCEGTWSAFDPP